MAMLVRTRRSRLALGVKFFVLLMIIVFYVSLPQKKLEDHEYSAEKGKSFVGLCKRKVQLWIGTQVYYLPAPSNALPEALT